MSLQKGDKTMVNKLVTDVAKKHASIAVNIMLYTNEMPNRQVDHTGTVYDLYELTPDMLKEMGWDDTCSKEELMKYFPKQMFVNAKYFGFSAEKDKFVMKYISGKMEVQKAKKIKPKKKNDQNTQDSSEAAEPIPSVESSTEQAEQAAS